jgi:hypothetical protein
MKVVNQVLPRGEVPITILLPHAPILVPEVAGERSRTAAPSVEAMRVASRG